MTTEEKARAYDEALEMAKKEWSNNLDNAYKNYRERLEIIFPEFKKSEDEKIRGAIIDHLKDYNLIEWADWLEKQGKEEYALKSFKDEDVRKFMQYIEKEAKAYEFNLPNRGYDIYAFAKDILAWLEKQG